MKWSGVPATKGRYAKLRKLWSMSIVKPGMRRNINGGIRSLVHAASLHGSKVQMVAPQCNGPRFIITLQGFAAP